ncbi:Cyclin, C-terminal domain [Dillenia turbinata]|uniref:Cyclin, C-terminal domain n=1 Tax=Dillenia turbinata TaxID=194707 RepID=A0AAN8VSZ4_9MAGN
MNQQNRPFIFDALYCEEEQGVMENYSDSEEEETKSVSPVLLEQDLYWEDEELTSLLSKEEPNPLVKNLQNDSSLSGSRKEALEWILKVNTHYSFSALTCLLAINYFDRFLSKFDFQRDKPWMSQLAAVACLSLAAKVEETQVPLLLDFQVEDAKYVFEAKTIQRTEILVLSTLEWKMNPVTPLSFLDYITRRVGLKTHLSWDFLRKCERVLLSLVLDSRFMCYLPSVMATATMLHVINSLGLCNRLEYQNQLLSILKIDEEKVDECCKLIGEVMLNGGHSKQCNKRKFGSVPGSPNGVIDVCFSCDSSNDSWAVNISSSASASVSSSPEPQPHSKKTRSL